MPIISLSEIDKDELQKIVNNSSSYNDVLRSMGYNVCTRAYKQLHKFISKLGIDESKMFANYAVVALQKGKRERKNNPYCCRRDLQKILKTAGIDEKCNECGVSSWNNKPLTCHIDHKDGDRTNNQLSNLRYLCPNCHSQTDTFGSKNIKKNHTCSRCPNVVIGYRFYCDDCFKVYKQQCQVKNMKFTPTKKELLDKIVELKYNMAAVGRFYNVSDNAIRKRCRKFEIRF